LPLLSPWMPRTQQFLLSAWLDATQQLLLSPRMPPDIQFLLWPWLDATQGNSSCCHPGCTQQFLPLPPQQWLLAGMYIRTALTFKHYDLNPESVLFLGCVVECSFG
jgi:hypothetical protein